MKVAKRKKRKKKQPAQHCKVVRNKRTGRKRKVCHKRRRRPAAAPVPTPLAKLPVPSAAAPPVTTAALAPDPGGAPAESPPPAPPPAADDGPFIPLSLRDAERLLWRAGFGPRPGDVARVAALGLGGAIRSLTRPTGAAQLAARRRTTRTATRSTRTTRGATITCGGSTAWCAATSRWSSA